MPHPASHPAHVLPQRRPPRRWRAGVLLALLLLSPGPASASLFGEENAPLTVLVAQGVASLSQAAETFRQLRQTYDETRRYVGMAQDAVNGFNQFKGFADSVLHQPDLALGALLPDAAYLVRDVQSPQGWAKGTGELQRLVSLCLSGGGACAQYREAVTQAQAREAISRTFGTSPSRTQGLEAIDVEAAAAIKGSMAASGQASVAAAQARALLEKCTTGTDAAAMQACQSAANVGHLLQVEQTALLNQQLAEANRLEAAQLAARAGEAKRAEWGAVQRERMLESGAQLMAPQKVRYSVEAPAGLEPLR